MHQYTGDLNIRLPPSRHHHMTDYTQLPVHCHTEMVVAGTVVLGTAVAVEAAAGTLAARD